MRRLLFACAAAFFLAGAAAAQEADPAQARIGELTLSYDAARWQVREADGGLTIDCASEACAGVAYDMTATPEPGRFCDRKEAQAASKAMFAFERHATNIHRLGDLALVMTQSSDGLLLDSPMAVYGCISRDGIVYRIASRFGPGQSGAAYAGGHALALLRGLSAPPPKLHDAELGGIVLTWRGDRWLPREYVLAGEPGALALRCLPPTCLDLGPALVASVRGSGGADCMAEQLAGVDWQWLGFREPWAIETRGGMSFSAIALGSGCRNWTPPRYIACTVHDGLTYVVETPRAFGCASSPEVPLDAFTEVVESARPRR